MSKHNLYRKQLKHGLFQYVLVHNFFLFVKNTLKNKPENITCSIKFAQAAFRDFSIVLNSAHRR